MIWIVAVLCIAVCGWYRYEGRWDRQLFASEEGRVCVNVHPHEAILFLEAHPETQVLDVRDKDEFCVGALPGAVNLSLGDDEFPQKSFGLERDRPVLVYCAGGYRSRKAAAILKEQGFRNIQHLHRGYHSWQFAGFPVLKPST